METIYLNHSKKIKMPILPDRIEMDSVLKKQWTFIGVYDLRELRDVFLVIKEYHHLSKSEVYQRVRELVKRTNADKNWQPADSRERDILEYQNALENLNLIDYDRNTRRFIITNFEVFQKSKLNQQKLLEQDKMDFKILFLNFSRFREILNWFSKDFSFLEENLEKEIFVDFDFNKLVNNTVPFYSFNRNGSKSVDSIIYSLEDNATIYTIDDSNKNFIRFWNVFSVLGEELNIVNSFSYPAKVYVQNDKTLNENYRAIRYNYVVNEKIDFDIAQYLSFYHKKEKNISIPDLIKELVNKFHYPIDRIKKEIVDQCNAHKDLFSLQRTSFAFIENNESRFFPLVNNFYMSHIFMRK